MWLWASEAACIGQGGILGPVWLWVSEAACLYACVWRVSLPCSVCSAVSRGVKCVVFSIEGQVLKVRCCYVHPDPCRVPERNVDPWEEGPKVSHRGSGTSWKPIETVANSYTARLRHPDGSAALAFVPSGLVSARN